MASKREFAGVQNFLLTCKRCGRQWWVGWGCDVDEDHYICPSCRPEREAE